MRKNDPFNSCLAVVLIYICVIIFLIRNIRSLFRFRNTEEVPPPVRIFRVENDLPQRDLVFDLDDSQYSYWHIGFINADGSGFTMRTFQADIFGFGPYHLQNFKNWNRTGTAIVTRFPDTPVVGHPLVFDQSGRAKICWDDIYISEGRLWLADDSSVIIRIEDEHEVGQIVLLDMHTCEPTRILYTETEGRTACEADLSQDGWLRVRLSTKSGQELAVINPAGEEVKLINDAIYPAWSADGQWLAYWKVDDGIFIEHRSEGEGRRIVKLDWYTVPTWSPDGKWLAYDIVSSPGQFNLLKVNVESGEQVLIFKGGLNPSWNWSMPADHSTD